MAGRAGAGLAPRPGRRGAGLRARARIEAETDGRGGTRVAHLRSEAPLLLRLAPGGRAHLVGGAAGPLGGDDLALAIRVGAGARLEVRGVAAMLAQPGPAGGTGRLVVAADVGEGGHLDWDVQPTIVIAGADLEVDLRIELAPGATLRWRDELVLGRSAEQPGRVRTRVRLVEDGRTTLDHCQEAGGAPGPWDGPGDLAGHRWLGSELRVDRAPVTRSPVVSPSARAADLVLASGAVLVVATATDRRTGLPLLSRRADQRAARSAPAPVA